jgi:hypothetical protein
LGLILSAALLLSCCPLPAGASSSSAATLASSFQKLYSNMSARVANSGLSSTTLPETYERACNLPLYNSGSPQLPWTNVFGLGTPPDNPPYLDVACLANNYYGGDEDSARVDVSSMLRDFAKLLYWGGSGQPYNEQVIDKFWSDDRVIINKILGTYDAQKNTSSVSEGDFCAYLNATIQDVPAEIISYGSYPLLQKLIRGQFDPEAEVAVTQCIARAMDNTADSNYKQFKPHPSGANWDLGSLALVYLSENYVDDAVDPGSQVETFLMLGGGGGGGAPTPPPVIPPVSPPAALDIIGSIYQASSAGQTLTFKFDPTALSPQDHPAVYYYDSTVSKWVRVGGTTAGDTVSYTADRPGYYYLNEDGRTVDDITLPPDAAASWAKAAISELYVEGMVGYPDGAYRPDRSITRAEFATIVAEALEIKPITPDKPTYRDVDPAAWYYSYVEACTKAGLIVGRGNGVFDPDSPITRQEIAVIMVKADGKAGDAAADADIVPKYTDSASIAVWARPFVVAAAADSLMVGYPDGSFGPLKNATRAECSQTIWNEIGAGY